MQEKETLMRENHSLGTVLLFCLMLLLTSLFNKYIAQDGFRVKEIQYSKNILFNIIS
jgi:hypothetical protein